MKNCVYILLVAIAFSFGLAGYKLLSSLNHPIKYQKIVAIYSEKYDIDEEVIYSVINVESGFQENAKSNKNALGLMQIKLSTANYLSELYNLSTTDENKLLTAEENIKFGTLYLKYLKGKFKNMDTVLACYNAGETRVNVWLHDGICSLDGETLGYIPYKETREYVEKVNKNIKFYSKI